MTFKSSSATTSTETNGWRGLYCAALFERDDERLPWRVAEAERAVIGARDLLATSSDNNEEACAIDEALYALRALRSCLKLKTREPAA